ncbi:MAG: glycerate kinase [Gudongella sp.]|jgi:glycerate kinase|nr:glycerate kinase [Gudongella sp.]
MKIIIAPCGLREWMSAEDMTDYMEKGIREVISDAEIIRYPLLKGDNPLSQMTAFGGKLIEAECHDPLGREITGKYAVKEGKLAVIDLKQASGLWRIAEEERNPLITSTFGTGELIEDALNKGYREFYLFTKGTATNDGGIGLLSKLGLKFNDSFGESVSLNGKGLYAIRSINTDGVDPRLMESKFTVVSDSSNYYSGIRGTAYEYGPLKGATPLMIQSLDRGLRNYAMEVEKETGCDVERIIGSGAGGGTGAGVSAFLKAGIISFVDAFREILGADEEIKTADFVLTGTDSAGAGHRLHKGMMTTTDIAKKYNVPVAGLFGYLGKEYSALYKRGFSGIYALFNDGNPNEIKWDKSALLIEKMSSAIIQMMLEQDD